MSKLLALVIEDNVDQAEILAKSLQTAGFKTETINDGSAAMSRLDAVVPDLVVLDLHLPVASGTGVLLKVRADLTPVWRTRVSSSSLSSPRRQALLRTRPTWYS